MKLNKNSYSAYQQYPEKVLQFGEGNFLRAFVDSMIDKMNKETDFHGSVVVVQPLSNGLVHKLNEQDGLYTLYLNGIKNGDPVSEHSVINCISRGINPYEAFDTYLAAAENPSLRFVISNTTEAGIAFDENDSLEDTPQQSFPGKLTAFLYRRFKAFKGDKNKGLIFIPCELIDKNGEKLKSIISQYALLWNLGGDFLSWLHEANTFCNSLVDRIVPGYPKDKIEGIKNELGYEDEMVVEGEQFHLWVIEGPQWICEEFPAEQAGLNVLFVDDLTPYRTRKVRILNGAHTSMVPVSYLYGIETVRETVEHDVLGKFVKDTVFDEIIPTLDLPKDELESFASDVLDRFKNPFIKHYLISIALNSNSKFETRVLPSILEYQRRMGTLPKRLVFSLAAMIAFYKGARKGEKITLQDDQDVLELYGKLWNGCDGTEAYYADMVKKLLGFEKLWKMDLNRIEGLRDAVVKCLVDIEKKGIEAAVNEVMA
ncbi:MAG: tagaturonate reductase [Bacillota bacterium]